MSTERPISLNLGMPTASPFETAVDVGQQGTPEQRDADQLAAEGQRMRALMGPGGAAPAPSSAPSSAPAPATPRPFDLFGGPAIPPPPASAVPATPESPPPGLAGADAALSQLASRLLVSDGSGGRRAVQIQLSDDSLAGVVLDVFEDEGRVVAQFVCALEPARERLARAAGWLAASLAQRIGRDVLVRVLADDPEDPCPVESAASPA